MNVGKICNRNVIIVSREKSIREAAVLMRKYHVGDVVVVDEKNRERFPIGILTDRDIVVLLVARDVDLDAVKVEDVMSFDLLSAQEEDDVMDTIKQMRSSGVRRIPVVNSRGGLEGIVAVDDLIELLSEQMADLVQLILRGQDIEYEKRP